MTIVGILTFISRKNSNLGLYEPENAELQNFKNWPVTSSFNTTLKVNVTPQTRYNTVGGSQTMDRVS